MKVITKKVWIRCTAAALALAAALWGSLAWQRQAVLTEARESHPNLYVEPSNSVNTMAEKTVYLTYDDGPSKNTPRILDVLKKHGVKATFFVIGKEDEESLALYRRIVEEGHTIAVHTYSHKYHEIYRSVDAYLEDFEKVENLIYNTTGVHPKIFRFPGGSVNSLVPSKQVHKDIIREITRRGYVFYDWNVVSGDDTATVYPAQTLADNVLKAAGRVKSPVVLFHDAPLCRTTPDATDIVIQRLLEQGYAFAALSEDTQPIQFTSTGN